MNRPLAHVDILLRSLGANEQTVRRDAESVRRAAFRLTLEAGTAEFEWWAQFVRLMHATAVRRAGIASSEVSQ